MTVMTPAGTTGDCPTNPLSAEPTMPGRARPGHRGLWGPVGTVKGVIDTVSGLPRELRELIESGPLVHLSTINADGSPQVSVIWIGLDGDDLVSGHMSWYAKLRNIERDPRVVLSFDALRAPGVFLNPYAVLRARATVQPSDDAWHLLNRLTKVYMSPN